MCMKKYLKITGVGLLGIALIFSSCIDSDYTPPDYDAILENNLTTVDKTKLAADQLIIDDSLHGKWHINDALIDTKGGVRYRVVSLGTGEKPVLTSNILMRYKGILFKNLTYSGSTFGGTTFDSNLAPDRYFPLYSVIAGMQTVLPLLPSGTTVQLFIPSGVGYGPYDQTNPTTGDIVIPKNSNLYFEVTLMDVQTPQ
jgi:FKBP-type peptidyl-prolyl cis-trans isomerase